MNKPEPRQIRREGSGAHYLISAFDLCNYRGERIFVGRIDVFDLRFCLCSVHFSSFFFIQAESVERSEKSMFELTSSHQ